MAGTASKNVVNDTAAAHVKSLLADGLKDCPKQNQKNSIADILTREDFEKVAPKMYLDLVNKMCDLEERLNKKVDAKDAKIRSLEDRTQSLESRIDEKDQQIATLHKYVLQTRLELEKLQQYENRDTFKICGIPEPTLPQGQYEDTDKTVTETLDLAEITLPQEDISISHRLPIKDPSKSRLPKAIIIKCKGRNIRNKVMRKKKSLKENSEFKAKYPQAFIVEHLTPLRSKVAHMLRNDDNIEKTWTIDGRIKVVKVGADRDARPISIDSLGELTKLGWTNNEIEKLVFNV